MKKLFKKYKGAAVAAAAVLIAVVAAVALHFANGWHVEFSEPDGVTETVECLTEYTPPAVTAKLVGRLFLRNGKPLETEYSGEYDTAKPGTHVLTWRAKCAVASGVCTRTLEVKDTTAPVITLVPEEREYVLPGQPYDDPGFSASDGVDGDLTDKVVRTEDTEKVTYTVSDSSGNETVITRPIPYNDPVPPVIKLKGDGYISFYAGEGSYTEPGYTASDNLDGDVTDKVKVNGSVDSSKVGAYTIKYTVTDAHGNTATESRTVVVMSHDKPAPTAAEPNGRVIYLTFDDGPSGYTSKLLDVLKKYGVKATFFVCGYGGSLDMMKREAAEGHTVAIHSLTHDYKKIYASEEAYFDDLNAMNEIIKQKTGSYSHVVRFPGGSSNKVSRFNPGIMTRLTKALGDAGYAYFDWNVDSNDAGGASSSDEVYRNVVNGCSGRKYSVVLQHDIKGFSVNAVERIIQWGLANGYTFAPLTVNSPVCHHGLNN